MFASLKASFLLIGSWPVANVHPVLKSGDSCLFTNYKPISVLSILAKVFESIVHKQVYSYFLSNNLLDSAQSGFHDSAFQNNI